MIDTLTGTNVTCIRKDMHWWDVQWQPSVRAGLAAKGSLRRWYEYMACCNPPALITQMYSNSAVLSVASLTIVEVPKLLTFLQLHTCLSRDGGEHAECMQTSGQEGQ